MKKIIILFLTFNFSLLTFNCFCQWVQTSFPNDLRITTLGISDTNFIAGVDTGGVYVSHDNGASWNNKNTGLYNSIVFSFASSGMNEFAGTVNGIFLSTDNGGNWTSENIGLSSKTHVVNTLAINGENIFAGTNAGVFLSTNNGAIWDSVNTGLTKKQVLCLTINKGNIFAGTYYGGLYLSTNYGVNWNALNNNLSTACIISLAANGGNLFAGTFAGDLFLSTNNGTSWKSLGLSNYQIYTFAFSGKNIFIGGNGGVFLSTNNGATWVNKNQGMAHVIPSIMISGEYIYAGTNGDGIWKRSLSEILGVKELGIRNNELGIKVYPNPTSQQTAISYQLPAKSHVTLDVFDLTGRKVEAIEGGEWRMESAGEHKINYNTEGLKSGVYFVKLSTDSGVETVKFVKE